MMGDWIYDNMGWIAIALTGLLITALITLGIANYEAHKNQHCVKSHQQMILLWISTGKGGFFMPTWVTECDKWVKNA